MPKQATDTVDTSTPEQAGAVTPAPAAALPQAADLPRESAQETVAMAAAVLGYVTVVRSQLERDVDGASDVRRRVAILADLVAKRDLSKGATRDMDTALRIVERALGLATRATPTKWRDVAPDQDTWDRCRTLADYGHDEFFAALESLRRAGDDASFDTVFAALSGNTPDAGELDTEPVDDHSDVSPEQVAATVTAALTYLSEAAAMLRRVTPELVATLEPAVAADWARRVWDDAIPVLTLRKNLIERGND